MFKFKFNINHFIKVINAREKLGMLFYRETEIKHPLLGKKCICLDDFKNSEKEYIVDKVVKKWKLGYYIVLLLKNKSKNHRVVYYENINCHDKEVLNEIEINQKRVHFIN